MTDPTQQPEVVITIADGVDIRRADTIYEAFAIRIVSRVVVGSLVVSGSRMIECEPKAGEALCVHPKNCYSTIRAATEDRILRVERSTSNARKTIAKNDALVAELSAELAGLDAAAESK